jgi:hypothetical protein
MQTIDYLVAAVNFHRTVQRILQAVIGNSCNKDQQQKKTNPSAKTRLTGSFIYSIRIRVKNKQGTTAPQTVG